MHKPLSIPFYEDTLTLLGEADAPMVAMRPIVENMGMDWKSQHAKLAERFKSTVVMITTVAEDGKNREMVCLPLRKLAAWLYSINPGKVAPELRAKIVRYQEQCDDVLWDYWSKGGAGRRGIQWLSPRDAAPVLDVGMLPTQLTLRDMLMLQEQKRALMRDIEQSASPAVRAGLFTSLRRVADALGEDVPELDAFALPKAQHYLEE